MANPFDQFDNPVVSGARDVGTALALGANDVVGIAGNVAKIISGKENFLTQKSKEISEALQAQKSPELLAAEQDRDEAVAEEPSLLYAIGTYVAKTATNPRLFTTTVAQIAPSSLGPGVVGAGAKMATGKLLAKKGTEFATKVGLGTAVGTGVGMQAADVGGQQMDELMRTLEGMDDQTAMQIPQVADLVKNKGYTIPVAKASVASYLAMQTALGAGTISALTQLIPGAQTIEKAIVGGAEKAAGKTLLSKAITAGKGAVKGAAGETAQEVSEEGGGQVLANVLARQVEPERELTAGVAPAVGQAIVGAGALGAAAGAKIGAPVSRPEPTPRPVSEGEAPAGMSGQPPMPAATKPSLAPEQAASLERSEEMTPEQFFATVNIRQARLLGGEPNAEDVALAGEVPPPRAVVSSETVNRALDEAYTALNTWKNDNPNAPENIVLIFDPEMMHNGYGIQGAFNPKDGTIFINTAFTPPERLGQIVSHEWAHATLATPEGQKAFADFALREIPQADLDALATRYGTQDRMVLLEEWIAENQEKAPGVISRIVARIREWLANFGIVNLNDGEVADIMLRTLREQAEGRVQPDVDPTAGGVQVDPNSEVYDQFVGNRLDTAPRYSLQKLPAAGDVVDAKGNLKYTIPQKTLNVSHYSWSPDLTVIDPAFYGTGAGQHYHRMMKGINKSFFFVGNSKPAAYENVSGEGMTRYQTTIDSSRIYNMDKDPLDLWFAPNPQKSEGMLKELGYDGFFAKTNDGRSFVAMFYPTDVETGQMTREAAPVEEELPEAPQESAEDYIARVEAEEAEARRKALRRASRGKYSLTEQPADLNKISNEPETQPAVETGTAPETLLAAPQRGESGGGGVSAPAAGVESRTGQEAPRRVGAQPNEEVRNLADAYNKEYNFGTIRHNHYVPLDEKLARRIADAYDKLPELDNSPETVNSYGALAREVNQQWDFAIENLGITFEPWAKEGQPYANSREMVKDVKENKHLYFFTGGEPHPLLGEVDPKTGLTMNDKFRAVHDLFGHAAEDYQFGQRGEENAWIAHSQMFSPEAQRALSTETRGQNSWVNSGAHNYEGDRYLNIPVSERPYAKQKVALLPEELTDWRAAMDREQGPKFSLAQTKTPEFRRWFKDSVAIDKNGSPEIYYHGSPNFEGTQFKPSEAANRRGNVSGYYFTPDGEEAGYYAKEGEGAQVIPVYLSIQNPFIPGKSEINEAMTQQYRTELENLNTHLDPSNSWFSSKVTNMVKTGTVSPNALNGDGDAYQRVLKAGGYDGFQDGRHLVAFEPTQIKSAFGNVGTFDPENPDFRYSLSQEPVSVSSVGVTKELLGMSGKVRIEDVAKALNEFSKERLKGSDFSDDQIAIAHGVMNAVAEGRNQLLLGDESGADWYDTDIETAKKYLRRALPGLKNDTDMTLFTAIMAPTSFGNNPLTNISSAVRIYEDALAKGDDVWANLSPRKPDGSGWTMRATAVQNAIERLNQLLADRGERGAVNWLLKKHPVSELRKYNERVSGNADDMKYGAYIFGPKGGPFFLNMNGVREEMTKDLWWTRTFNRWFGTMEKTISDADVEEGLADEEGTVLDDPAGFRIQDAPRNDAERRRMDAIANAAADELGLTIEELQATLWYYEQQLWKRLGAKVESYSFKDGALRILKKRGIEAPRVRRSDSPNERRRQAAYLLAASEGRGGPAETAPAEPSPD